MKKIFSIVLCLFCCLSLFFGLKLNVSAQTNKYVFKEIPFTYIDQNLIIEDYRSSNEWFMSNNNLFTTIEFEYNTDSVQDYTNMYFVNNNNGIKILACRFWDALGGYAIPYYTDSLYEIIEVIGNLPYENAQLWQEMFTQLNTKTTFNVSIAEDYVISLTRPNFDDSIYTIYHGVFKYNVMGEERYFDQMVLTGSPSAYYIILNYANSNNKTQLTLFGEQVDEQSIIIEQMYSYTSEEFPSYITRVPINVDSWQDFFYRIIDVPLYYLYSLTSFEIFGINVWLGIGSVILVAFIVFLVKRLI